MRKEYTGKQRSELLRLVSSGRATVSEAATRLGVNSSTAYYWVQRAAGAAQVCPNSGKPPLLEAAPTFVRVVPSSEVDVAITVRVGGAEIWVRRGFDGDLLRAVVDALGGGVT